MFPKLSQDGDLFLDSCSSSLKWHTEDSILNGVPAQTHPES
jgi:hypothetical protein